jgi:hypothetical protein
MPRPLSLSLPAPSARRRQRRSRYWRRWNARKRAGLICEWTSFHLDDLDAMVKAGFLKAEDRDDRRKVRAALQRVVNMALDNVVAGRMTFYESRALGVIHTE